MSLAPCADTATQSFSITQSDSSAAAAAGSSGVSYPHTIHASWNDTCVARGKVGQAVVVQGLTCNGGVPQQYSIVAAAAPREWLTQSDVDLKACTRDPSLLLVSG